MTAVERFWALFSDTLLPRYLEENGYEPGGLVDDKIVAESDAEWFIAAVRSGLADPLPRGEYWLPASRYRASPFWELGTKTKPEQITLWVEGLVTIATAARLHFLYGWPKETLGFESEDYAFDLIGRLPGRAHEYLAGEAKASTANLAALIADITSCAEKGEHDEASHTKAERNAHKKWAGLCRSRAPVLFVFGPDRAATIFRVSYPSRFGVRFESAGDDALEYPGITARGDSLERSIVINASSRRARHERSGGIDGRTATSRWWTKLSVRTLSERSAPGSESESGSSR